MRSAGSGGAYSNRPRNIPRYCGAKAAKIAMKYAGTEDGDEGGGRDRGRDIDPV